MNFEDHRSSVLKEVCSLGPFEIRTVEGYFDAIAPTNSQGSRRQLATVECSQSMSVRLQWISMYRANV